MRLLDYSHFDSEALHIRMHTVASCSEYHGSSSSMYYYVAAFNWIDQGKISLSIWFKDLLAKLNRLSNQLAGCYIVSFPARYVGRSVF